MRDLRGAANDAILALNSEYNCCDMFHGGD